jgi:hypothetical protein
MKRKNYKPLQKKEIPTQRRTYEEWSELQTNDYNKYSEERLEVLCNLLGVYPVEYIIPEDLKKVEIEITKEKALQILKGKKVVEICPSTEDYLSLFLDDKVEEFILLHEENDDVYHCIDSKRVPKVIYFHDTNRNWQLTVLCNNVAIVTCNEKNAAIYKEEYNDDTVEKLSKNNNEPPLAFAVHIGEVLSHDGLETENGSGIRDMQLKSPLKKREIPKQRRTFEEWQQLEETDPDKLEKEQQEVVNELLGIYPVENIIAQPLRNVNLIMKKKFAKEILKGEKKIEWRPVSDHYVSRLIDSNVSEFINLHEAENDDVAFCITDLRIPTVIHFYSYSNTWHLDVLCDCIEAIPCTEENAKRFKDKYNDGYIEGVVKSTKHLDFTPHVFALHIGKILSHSGL